MQLPPIGISAPTEVVLVLLAGLISVLAALGSRKMLTKHGISSGPSNMAGVVAFAGVFVIASLALSPTIAGKLGVDVTPAAEEEGPYVPGEQVTAYREGYVLAAVEDEYKVPKTVISGSTVYVSASQPVVGEAWPALGTENTDSSGSALVAVKGVTSGTVYVTAGATGYYPDITTTSIPGAQVVNPALTANIRLSKVGTFKWSTVDRSDNVTPNPDNIEENLTESLSHYFTLCIYTEDAYTALEDLRIMLIRGDDWSTLGASVAPVVVDAAGCSITTTGDTTLSSQVTGSFLVNGDVTYGETLKIKFTTACTSAADGTIAKIYIDDLNGSKDVLGGSGITENVISITAVD